MIALRRANERHHDRRRGLESWRTFHAHDGTDRQAGGFGPLERLDEFRLQAGEGILPQPHGEAEIITYIREGALAYQDSLGASGVLCAGEFQRLTIGRGTRHGESNASRADGAHLFQLWLHPAQAGLEPARVQKRFSAGNRRGLLCPVASPDGRRGSLALHLDALLYSAMLSPGQHVVHELAQGRTAWLHLVEGEAVLGDVVLTTGDGAGFTAERAVSLTAKEETEVLLLDLGATLPWAR